MAYRIVGTAGRPDDWGDTLRRIDIGIGGLVAGFGLFLLRQALGLGFLDRGSPGPGFWPALLSGALVVLGLVLVVSRLAGGPAGGDFDPPSRSGLRRVLGVWILVLASTLLMEPVGFTVAMVLLSVVIVLVVERKRSVFALVAAVALPVGVYWLFSGPLQVSLPTGLFGY